MNYCMEDQIFLNDHIYNGVTLNFQDFLIGLYFP